MIRYGRLLQEPPRPLLLAAALALDRAPADVVAVELARPGDAGHFGVSALLGVGNAVAQRAHAQHAAARGDGAVAVQAGAGMANLGVVHVRPVPGRSERRWGGEEGVGTCKS